MDGPETAPTSGPAMYSYINQETTGNPKLGKTENDKYDGDEDLGPPGHRSDKVCLGKHQALFLAHNGTLTASHKGGSTKNLLQKGGPLQKSTPRGRTNTNPSAAGEYTRPATVRVGDIGVSESTPHKTNGWTVRDAGETPEVVSCRGIVVEGPHHTKVLDHGKYKTDGVTRGPLTREYYLENSGPNVKVRGIFQSY